MPNGPNCLMFKSVSRADIASGHIHLLIISYTVNQMKRKDKKKENLIFVT